MADEAHLPSSPQAAPTSRPRYVWDRLKTSADLLVCALAALGAVTAVALLPDGSALRVALVAPIILVVPGYLALQTLIMRESTRGSRLVHVLLALGISPALIGVLALATVIVNGAFRSQWIVAFVTVACLFLAFLADYRRVRYAAQAHATPRLARMRRAPTGVENPAATVARTPINRS